MDKKELLEYFNKKFDTRISRRMKKLTEEFNELVEAVNSGKREDIIDELADVNGVLFHIAGILGYTQDELLEMCADKVTGVRKTRTTNVSIRM